MPSELTMSDLSLIFVVLSLLLPNTLASLYVMGVVRSAKARSVPPRDEPIIDVSYPSYLSRADLSVLSADLYLSVF
jgi:hypothetical protein